MPPDQKSEDSEHIGQRVWCKIDTDEDLWVLGTVEQHFQGNVHIRRMHTPPVPSGAIAIPSLIIVPEKEFKDFKPANATDVDHALEQEDLVTMEDPQEWTMLHVLRERYEKETIFTSIGPVLIAINPYKPVDQCKATSIAKLTRLEFEALPAHAFQIASAAYSGLIEAGSAGEPQSILVSGESGAGKTETTKILVACLALVSNSSGAVVESALESGLLLEAFGNARTVYNNNSSRFGKWCAVHFDDAGRMASCSLTAFLLEQSRIVKPAEGERNYHIFYHFLAGASKAERAQWELHDDCLKYTYLQGERTSPGVDDAALWTETTRRMYGLGFASEMQRNALYQQLASLLALGNVTFKKAAGGGSSEKYDCADKKQLHLVARLLEVEPEKLETNLTTRKMVVRGEGVLSHLTEEQCVDARDALAKAVYSAIFDHLVERLNHALGVPNRASVDHHTVATHTDAGKYIGLLDIFGFENFKLNGFEQLCINFTNERLQQFFMDALIKRERAEYNREGILCDHIEYPDNSGQVSLLDDRKQGVFALLDEECRAPNGTEARYVEKMHAAFASKEGLYSKPKFGSQAVGQDLGPEMAKKQFVIHHYAEDVQYTAHGWLEKNRGKLHPDMAKLLTTSRSPLLQMIAPPAEDSSSKAPTVSGVFRASLKQLSATMIATHQHFIRCIKPNPEKVPGRLQGDFVARQLRYLGVNAVVEINRRGYPVKQLFEDFIRKYRCIAFDEPHRLKGERAAVVASLLEKASLPKDGPSGWGTTRTIQIGKTKVFLKPEIVPILEKPRRAARLKASVKVQTYARRRLARRIYAYAHAHDICVTSVRNVLDRPDPDTRAQTIEMRVADAGLVLDELALLQEQAEMSPAIAPILGRCHAKKDALEIELRTLAHGLEAEEEATQELEEVLKATKGTSKEAFLKLKEELAKAHEASQDITEELRVAIRKTEGQVEARFRAMVSEWEAEVQRQAEEREKARRERAVATAQDLQRQVDEAIQEQLAAGADAGALGAIQGAQTPGKRRRGSVFGMFGGGNWSSTSSAPTGSFGKAPPSGGRRSSTTSAASAPSPKPPSPGKQKKRGSIFALTGRTDLHSGLKAVGVEVHNITVRNALDPTAQGKQQLLGCSPTIGIVFSDVNAVSRLISSGTAAADGHLHVGDVVLKIDGVPLDGRKAVDVMDEMQKGDYTFYVVRLKGAPKDEDEELPFGEHSGWVHMTPAKQLFVGGLTAAGPSHKCWGCLQHGVLMLYEETVRGEKRTKKEFPLDGASCKAPPSSKKAAARASLLLSGVRLEGHARINLNQFKPSLAATAGAKASAGSEGGDGAKKGKGPPQPKVMQEYVDRGLFPFKCTWPQKTKDSVIVLAAHTPAERKGWCKAIDGAIKALEDQAPTYGYLQKRRGRGGGLFKFGWSRRWFELLQAKDGVPASFTYYESETADKATPRGVVTLNQHAMLLTSASLAVKSHEHVFAVSSRAEGETKDTTIVLAADTETELEKWTSAIGRALHSFKPKEAPKVQLSHEEALLQKKTLPQLKLTLEYMGVLTHKDCDDKNELVVEIMRQRKVQAASKAKASGDEGELGSKLKKDEERLMHRDVDELRQLLDFMDVEYDRKIDSKERLINLIINQKRIAEAAKSAQRIYRKSSSSHLSRRTDLGGDQPAIDVGDE